MIVQFKDSLNGEDRILLLCDDDGVALPGQLRCILDQSPRRSELTVTFMIDGKDIRLEV